MYLAVVDLDGTLISSKITRDASVYAYEKGLQKLRELEINIPEELKNYTFANLNKMIRVYPQFEMIYLTEYKNYLRQKIDELREHQRRAKNILGALISIYMVDEFKILTANRAAMEISKIIGVADFPLVKDIIIVPGINYVEEKAAVIQKLKEKYEKVIYIADCPINDAEIARRSNVEFINIKDLLITLYSIETRPYDLLKSKFSEYPLNTKNLNIVR